MKNFKPGANLTESLNNLAEYESSLHKIIEARRVSVSFVSGSLQNKKEIYKEIHKEIDLPVGRIHEYGAITDRDGMPAGSINKFGGITDTSGRPKGSIDKCNNIIDSSGRLTGRIDSFGNIYKR